MFARLFKCAALAVPSLSLMIPHKIHCFEFSEIGSDDTLFSNSSFIDKFKEFSSSVKVSPELPINFNTVGTSQCAYVNIAGIKINSLGIYNAAIRAFNTSDESKEYRILSNVRSVQNNDIIYTFKYKNNTTDKESELTLIHMRLKNSEGLCIQLKCNKFSNFDLLLFTSMYCEALKEEEPKFTAHSQE